MLQILQHILQYQLFHYWLSIDSQFPTSNFAYKKDTKAMKQIITSLGFIIKPLENNLPFSTVSFFFIWCNNSVCHAFHKKPSGSYHLSVSQIQTHPSSFYSSLSESTPDTNSDPNLVPDLQRVAVLRPSPPLLASKCQARSIKQRSGLWEEVKLCLTLRVCWQTMTVSRVDRFRLPPLHARPTNQPGLGRRIKTSSSMMAV